jgi:cell wall-associated NlpC family hydrolase
MQLLHYDVQVGDTVSSLSERFNISENTILWSNNLPSDGQLSPGQQVVILPVSGVLYTVQPGDTTSTIADRFQSDGPAIAEVNQLTDPVHPTVGSQLIVPGGRIEDVARPELSARSIARPQPDSPNQIDGANPPQQLVVNPSPVPAADDRSELTAIRVPFAQRAVTPTPGPLVPIVYTVVSGDTLLAIAGKFGVSPESIASASGMQSTDDTLAINQKLVVPPIPGVIHVVREGDTLNHIAELYSADASAIAKANLLVEPFQLQIGQTLVVPDGKVSVASPAQSAPASALYTVEEGDNLSRIADAYGVGVDTLISLNHLADPFLLQPGQQIVVRGTAGGSQVVARSESNSRAQTLAPSSPAVIAPAVVYVRPTATPAPRLVARPAVVAPAVVHSNSSGSWGVVSVASKYLGSPYVWGGTSPAGFDCSGFVWYVYQHAGIPIPRDMWGQLQSGTRVSQSNLQPGDIVFFAGTYEAGLSHDGIYIGGGRFIHAADYGLGVIVSSLYNSYYANHYFGAVHP